MSYISSYAIRQVLINESRDLNCDYYISGRAIGDTPYEQENK